MKLKIHPEHGVLFAVSFWISWVCAGLLSWSPRGDLMAGSYSIWGDWSAHFTFIEAFRERGAGWITGDNPLFAGEPFRYPFLSHLLTAATSFLTGGDTVLATRGLSVILLFILPGLIHRFFKVNGFSSRASLFSTLLFVFMGGFQWMDSSLAAHEPLTNQFQQGSVFTQFILFEIFPQRAFLFGMTILLAVLTSWLRRERPKLTITLIHAFGLSLLVFTHLHSWIAMGTLLLMMAVFPAETGPDRKSRWTLGILTLVFSIPGLVHLFMRKSEYALPWDLWLPGWAQNQGTGLATAAEMGFAQFWIYNTGLFLLLAGAGLAYLLKNRSSRALGIAGLILFLIPLFLNLQPYFYDNLKTFTYSFLFLAPFAGVALEKILEVRRIPFWARALLLAVILVSQTASAISDFRFFDRGMQKTVFFHEEEFRLAEQFKAIRGSPDDLSLIVPRHNHWLPCLTGTPVVMGYAGWLWSWGISYSAREAEVKEILSGGPRAEELIRKYRLRFFAMPLQQGQPEAGVNGAFFESRFRLALSSTYWRVYSLEEAAKSPSTSVR
jgi:hypothetical protein